MVLTSFLTSHTVFSVPKPDETVEMCTCMDIDGMNTNMESGYFPLLTRKFKYWSHLSVTFHTALYTYTLFFSPWTVSNVPAAIEEVEVITSMDISEKEGVHMHG